MTSRIIKSKCLRCSKLIPKNTYKRLCDGCHKYIVQFNAQSPTPPEHKRQHDEFKGTVWKIK